MRIFSISVFTLLAFVLSSCGKAPVPTQEGLPPAPSPQESVESIGSTLENNPTFRSCVANASKSCGLEVVASIARSAKDATGCEVFDNEEIKKACVDAVKLELAKQSGDLTKCAIFTSPDQLSACQIRLLNYKAQKEASPTICRELFANEGLQLLPNVDPVGPCEYQQLINTRNPLTNDFCKALSSQSAQNECKKRLAISLPNAPASPKIP
jgi:hypothetical protein